MLVHWQYATLSAALTNMFLVKFCMNRSDAHKIQLETHAPIPRTIMLRDKLNK
jgi:hypothetical protein